VNLCREKLSLFTNFIITNTSHALAISHYLRVVGHMRMQ